MPNRFRHACQQIVKPLLTGVCALTLCVGCQVPSLVSQGRGNAFNRPSAYRVPSQPNQQPPLANDQLVAMNTSGKPNPPIGNLPPVDPQHRVVVRDESVEFYPHEPSQADARYAQERSQPNLAPREQSFTTQPAQAVPPDIFPRIRMLANELRRESPERAAAFLSAIEKSEPSGWPTIVSAWSATHLIRRDLRLSQSADAAKTKNSALGAVADRAPELPQARRRAEPQPSAAHDFMNFNAGEDASVQKVNARYSDLSGMVDPAVSEELLQTEVSRLVRMMEAQAEQLRDPAFLQDRQRLELSARVMALLANDRSKALETIESMPAQERQFARELLVALDALVGASQQPRSARQAEAIDHLQNAVNVLREQTELDCSVPIFCSKVDAFQKFVPFQEASFLPGQQVLIYWEVRNFSSQLVPDGFKTSIQPKLEIIDQSGRVRVLEHEPQNEYTTARRQDYFMTIQLNWPKELPAGAYTLRATTSDRLNERQCVRDVNFVISQPARRSL